MCQCQQHRTSNTHTAELKENALLVDPVNGSNDLNLHYPCLQTTLQFSLQCKRHAQKCSTGTQTFLISDLVVGSTKLCSMNRPRRTYTRHFSTLDNTDVFSNSGRRRTFRNWSDIDLSPASRETTQTNKPQNSTLRLWAIPSAVL